MNKLHYVGCTGSALRFGFKDRLYGRRFRNGQWVYAYDQGVWLKCEAPEAAELEKAFEQWLATGPLAERRAARVLNWMGGAS